MFKEIATEVQIRKFSRFLEDYTCQLEDIKNVLEQSSGDCWDLFLDPVALQVSLDLMTLYFL